VGGSRKGKCVWSPVSKELNTGGEVVQVVGAPEWMRVVGQKPGEGGWLFNGNREGGGGVSRGSWGVKYGGKFLGIGPKSIDKVTL